MPDWLARIISLRIGYRAVLISKNVIPTQQICTRQIENKIILGQVGYIDAEILIRSGFIRIKFIHRFIGIKIRAATAITICKPQLCFHRGKKMFVHE